ncbi:outer membrane protein [Pedomonas mirosovicensis]|uniref:outer membrane protein n=1 Tax=Pedomonas mirosovicensis TaxID=2908641 RepID=UPI00216A22C3|nr:outer membrane beta-barrel protein [Pedomonas mirosovicensis]MCH8684868.1 outer membrane beta-barrel protein [Pedomonas mirosovicensis]
MRKLSVAVMMTTTLLAGTAFAQDDAWYLGLKGGVSIIQDRTFTQKDADADAFQTDHKAPGWGVSGQVGYDFGKFRTEFELGYQQGKMTHFFNEGLPELGSTDYFWDGRGTTRVTSFMLNGLFDIPTEGKTSAYIGGGVGLAHLKAKNYRVAEGANAFLNDGDTAFAWQAIAGLRRELSESTDLTLEYRYFKATSGDFRSTGGTALEGDFRSHSLMLGVAFNFGTKKEEPAAPPPPPPPAAAAPAAAASSAPAASAAAGSGSAGSVHGLLRVR